MNHHKRRLLTLITRLLAVLAVTLATGTLCSSEQAFFNTVWSPPIDRAAFASPNQSVRPAIRWWWPGGAVNDSELGRELRVMHDAGFGSAEIQSFAVGLPPDAPRSVFTYGSAAWFDHLAAAVHQARALGMNIDLTLGSAWPSGGSYIPESRSLKMLTVTAKLVSGPALLDAPVPAPVKPLSYPIASFLLKFPDTYDSTKMKRLAVLAAKLDSDQRQDQVRPKPTLPNLPDLPATVYLDPAAVFDLTSAVTSGGRVHWQVPDGNWLLFALYQGPTGTRPFYSADSGARVLDHFNRDAINTHLRAIAQTAADRLGFNFGTTLRSLFVDSLELRTELYWTDDFLSQFYARRRYRLEPFLPVLFKLLADDAYLDKIYPTPPPSYEMRKVGPRVRQDYDQTVSELAVERFFAPIRQWADAHGVGARLQAHGSPTDYLNSYRQATIPETEGLYAGGNPSFLRLAASAGHLSGRPIISSEILAFKDNIATPTTILAEANKHLAAGINNLVLHGFPYVYDTGFARPGWMPFNSPYLPGKRIIGTFGSHLNDRNPLWRFMPGITDYLARAQLVLRTGAPVVDIALYTGKPDYPDDETYDPKVSRELTRSGYNYDYVNGDVLQSGSLTSGALQIGSNRYRALVVSDVRRMTPALADRIAAFAQNGLPVVLAGDVPDLSVGYFNYRANDARVRQQFEQITGNTRDALRKMGKFRSGSVLFILDPAGIGTGLASDLGIAPDVTLGDGGDVLSYAHRHAAGADYFFVVSSSSSVLNTHVSFPNSGGRFPEIWDLQTGLVQPAVVYSSKGDRTDVLLHFDPGRALVIGFDTVGAPVHLEATNMPAVRRTDRGELVGVVSSRGTYTLVLNGGITRQVTVDRPNLPPIGLPTWDLIVATEDEQGNRGSQAFRKTSLRDLSSMPGLRNFAGWADYAAYIDFAKVRGGYRTAGTRLVLDLNQVYDVAEVRVNNKSVATLSTAPYQIDVTDYLISGLNKFEVAVSSGRGGTPAGLLGPVNLVPLYKITLPGFRPLQTSVVVTPSKFPNNTVQDMLDAIRQASQLMNHVNFQWFWRTPPNGLHPEGGAIVECRQVTTWVKEARRLRLGVTLQFQTFYTEINGSYGGALDGFKNGLTPKVHVATPVAPLATATFADPHVSNAYLDQIACLAALKPEYLVLGPEVNFLYVFNRREWNAYLPIYAKAYTLAKSISPTTQVGLSYQYDGLRQDRLFTTWDQIRQAGPQDYIGLTTYYGFSDDRNAEYPVPSAIPANYYHPIREVLGPTVPVIFTEIGWSSHYANGLQTQAEFLRRLPVLLEDVHPDNICWALLHDVQFFEGAGESLNEAGLLTRDGRPKPSWVQAMLFKSERVFLDTFAHVFAPPPMPFSVTATPPNFPQRFSDAAGYQAIATAGQASRHVGLEFSWRDRVTGQVWGCREIQRYTDEARRLGLRYTIQWNTYATLPSAVPGQSPKVILLNPIVPPVNDSDTRPSLSMPKIRNAFLQEIGCLAGLGSDYLVLGPEVNFLVGYRPGEFNVFKDVYRQAYNLVKATSPNVRVGLSYQYEGVRSNLLRGEREAYIEDAGPQDFLGLTSYFSYSAQANQQYPYVTDIPSDYYSPIRVRFGPKVPVVFTGVGWSSFFPRGRENQVLFLNRLPLLLRDIRPVNVFWALQHDILGYFRGEIEPLNHLGLRQYDGTPKPAWNQAIWLKNQGIYTSAGRPPAYTSSALPRRSP